MEQIAAEQNRITNQVQELQKNQNYQEKGFKNNVMSQLLGASIPHLKLVQTLTIQNSR